MLDFVRWNLSKSARRAAVGTMFFISCPKSGRTWVRVFYFAYLAKLTGQEFSLEPGHYPGRRIMRFSHERWEHRQTADWREFLRGRHLLPAQARRENTIVLMARDPRDVVVSLYFHLTRRKYNGPLKPQNVAEMLRNRKQGIAEVIDVMNGWLAEWHGRPGFKLIRYEDCQKDPAGEFRSLLEFLGLAPVDEAAFAHALEFSRFNNMQAGEAAGKFKEDILSAGDVTDPDSFKARRGKVGGFRDYFHADDLAYAAEQMRRLDPRFGYDIQS
jgi:hypothetical protein